jgi:hypothetical protein
MNRAGSIFDAEAVHALASALGEGWSPAAPGSERMLALPQARPRTASPASARLCPTSPANQL